LNKVKILCNGNQHIKNLELSYLESDVGIGIKFFVDDVFVIHAIESIWKFCHQLLILPMCIILMHKFFVLFLFGYTSTFISFPFLVFSKVLMVCSCWFANTQAIFFLPHWLLLYIFVKKCHGVNVSIPIIHIQQILSK